MIVIYQMIVYWQLSLLLLLLPDVRSCTNVTDCPYSEDEYRNRSISYKCHSGGFKYHCLKTTSGHLVEKCHPRRGMNEKDGCPTFDFRNASYRIIQTRCTGPQQGCPHQNETFFSYEVYKFPSCLPPRLDRSMPVRLDTETSIHDYRETTVGPELTTQFDQTKPTSRVQYDTTNKDLTVTKQTSEVSFIDKNLLVFVIGGISVAAIIVGFICLVLIQCKRIKEFKLQMERSNYMSSVPYNSHATHIYHQDTDIYDYVDDTDMKDDDKNLLESNELRQKSDDDDESSSEAYVEPNRPSIESMERNEILDINTQMKNAPLSCNIIRQDTYMEPNVGLLTNRIRRDNVDVIENDGSMPLQNQRVCVKLTRLVSNDSYVEPSIGLVPSCKEECSVKEESFSVLRNTNITENEIAQKVDLRSEELNLQDLNSDVHYDDASSCINTLYKKSSNPRETDINICDIEGTLQTESTLNFSVRRNENVVISYEPVETKKPTI